MNKDIGSLLRSLRESQLLTQFQISSEAGLSLRHYQDIEYGNKNIRVGTLGKILKVHNLNIYNFFDSYVTEIFYKDGIGALRNFVDSQGFSFCRTDKNGLITEVCPRGGELTGYDSEEVVGKMYFWDTLESELEKVFTKNLLKIVLLFKPKPMAWSGYIKTKKGKKTNVRGYWRYGLGEDGEICEFEMISFRIEIY